MCCYCACVVVVVYLHSLLTDFVYNIIIWLFTGSVSVVFCLSPGVQLTTAE